MIFTFDWRYRKKRETGKCQLRMKKSGDGSDQSGGELVLTKNPF